MRALVVYESMFGNTRDVALAIADGLATRLDVDTVEVGKAPLDVPPEVSLLVVGCPTHAHGMTTPKSRADSAQRAGERLVSRGRGMDEWLASVGGSTSVAAAAFDTRIKGPGFVWGSAAKSVAELLKDAGFRLVRPAQSFLVGGPTGPLFDRIILGELERARAGGRELASEVAAAISRR